MAERKGDEINQKIVELENELRTILFDRHQVEELRQTEGRQPIERQQVLGDTQSMANTQSNDGQSIAKDENRCR